MYLKKDEKHSAYPHYILDKTSSLSVIYNLPFPGLGSIAVYVLDTVPSWKNKLSLEMNKSLINL